LPGSVAFRDALTLAPFLIENDVFECAHGYD
jgi:hypothetical protein